LIILFVIGYLVCYYLIDLSYLLLSYDLSFLLLSYIILFVIILYLIY